MIGVKSATATGLAAIAAATAAWRGRLAIDHLATLGPSSCFAIGLFAGLATALIAIGVRPRLPSRLALGWQRRRIVIAPVTDGASARDLPAGVQRGLWIVAFGCVGLAVFTNPGTARLVALPAHMTDQSAGEYCKPPPKPAAEPATPAPPPKPVEIPGCALVKRAVALGYAKSLGNCAPKDAPGPVKVAIAAAAPCTKRQPDEPYLHYAYRKLAGAGGAIAGADPIDAIEAGIDEKQIQLDHLDTLIATHRHSVSGTPHASHHIFVTLPDPHPPSLVERVDPPRCDDRYADLPLWPARGTKDGALVDHVLGQLLFASRFGTTASCGDYTIHWGAAPDTCAKLRANPIAVLDAHDALAPVRDALDRRRRALEVAALDVQLGRKPPPAPPAASVIVSMTCVDTTSEVSAPTVLGGDVAIDGEPVSVREVHVHGVDGTGSGVIALYAALARVLGGDDTAPAVVEPAAANEPAPADASVLDHLDYRLVRLDRLHDTDPFTGGTRWPLDSADLREVYPIARELRTFVDGFRRRYKSQRGRL